MNLLQQGIGPTDIDSVLITPKTPRNSNDLTMICYLMLMPKSGQEKESNFHVTTTVSLLRGKKSVAYTLM